MYRKVYAHSFVMIKMTLEAFMAKGVKLNSRVRTTHLYLNSIMETEIDK